MIVGEILEKPSRAVNPEQLNRKAGTLQLPGKDEIISRHS